VTEIRNPEESPRPDRRWRITVISLVPIVAVAALLGFGLGRDPTDVDNALVGTRAPAFHLRDVHTGRMVRMSQLRGHPIVLNFWASWCVPCIEEHPVLIAAWQRFGDRGVVFLSVMFEDRLADAAAFEREHGATGWPNLEDPRTRTALDYGVRGVPETFFIGRDGVIRAQHSGPVTYEIVTRDLQPLLERSGSGLAAGPGP
jgi:cytochrome c biogenesis protein CcmG/thiol:disulfide interchange protein DsbE